ncbi:hypothetical protein LOK49_Contig289G00006 [Camellia lanceoleosa]|nr:hypothetical protein LOK49_Contig289G00006 [Camellia lanceoleosa]
MNHVLVIVSGIKFSNISLKIPELLGQIIELLVMGVGGQFSFGDIGLVFVLQFADFVGQLGLGIMNMNRILNEKEKSIHVSRGVRTFGGSVINNTLENRNVIISTPQPLKKHLLQRRSSTSSSCSSLVQRVLSPIRIHIHFHCLGPLRLLILALNNRAFEGGARYGLLTQYWVSPSMEMAQSGILACNRP